jgi:hypothetical protein
MATVHVTMNYVQARALTGATLEVAQSVPEDAATVTSSGSSAEVGGIVGVLNGVWTVTAIGGDVWVAFGTNPTAGADSGHLIPAGSTRDFGVTAAGEEIAIKDA